MAFQRAFSEEGQDAGMFEVAGQIERETLKAILLFDGTRTAWLPKSKIKIERSTRKPDQAVVLMPEWLAKEAKFV